MPEEGEQQGSYLFRKDGLLNSQWTNLLSQFIFLLDSTQFCESSAKSGIFNPPPCLPVAGMFPFWEEMCPI